MRTVASDTTFPADPGKFDEFVAAAIRAAADEWRVHNNPADVHGVSMQEYIRRALADASLLASTPHAEHSLCLEWDDTHEGFTIISDGAEARHVLALVDTVRQVMQERDAARAETQGLSHALLLKGYRGFANQVDAMAKRIRELDFERLQQRDVLRSIWLHVSWRSITAKLTTAQRELWADAVEARDDLDSPAVTADRWWKCSIKGCTRPPESGYSVCEHHVDHPVREADRG